MGAVAGEAVLPGGQRRSQVRVGAGWPAPRTAAAARAAEHLGGAGAPCTRPRLLEDLARELVPGAGAGGRPCGGCRTHPVDQADERRRRGARCRSASRPGRDDQHLAVVAGQAQHRLDEVGAADPEQPGGADDEVALVGGRGRLLARRAWCGRRRRAAPAVGLDVGRALGAVEDVVAGDVDDGGAELRGGRTATLRAGPVDGERGRLLGLLGAVDVGPGGAIDDDVGTLEVEPALDRGGVGDVQLGPAVEDLRPRGRARTRWRAGLRLR